MRGKLAKRLRKEAFHGLKPEVTRYKTIESKPGLFLVGLRFKYQFLKKNWKLFRQENGRNNLV